MHDLLRIADLTGDELVDLLELALRFRADPAAFSGAARGRCVAILFEKPSLRTRFSVEAALIRIGAHPIGAYDREVGMGSREPVADVARVLSRYAEAIVIRTFAHERAAQLAEASEAPVVNALSDEHHPLQALADVMTLCEITADGDPRGLKDIKLAYVGDGNNVAHSLIEAAALTGMTLHCACPPAFEPSEDVSRWARDAGGRIEYSADPAAAVRGANAVYTDVWTSMGRENEAEDRRRAFAPYAVTAELMAKAAPGAIFLHCLPAHRGEEVAAEVIDGSASAVWQQAENRMHTAAAMFLKLLGGA